MLPTLPGAAPQIVATEHTGRAPTDSEYRARIDAGASWAPTADLPLATSATSGAGACSTGATALQSAHRETVAERPQMTESTWMQGSPVLACRWSTLSFGKRLVNALDERNRVVPEPRS